MAFRGRAMLSRPIAVLCSILIITGESSSSLRPSQDAGATDQAAKIPNDQLDSLVAPIALYQDPLLAQVLAASTYPLEIMQLQQWLSKNQGLKDKALEEAVMKQPWDPTVQALAALPDVVKRLANDIQWTTDLGNAVLAQQSDVMDAVQRMRAKAQEKGNLKSTEQQKVETKVVENKSVIVIEQAKPDVVYVPSYEPTVVYGPPAYPYPPIAYPPPGYYAAGMAISFGVGMMMGAAWGGGWCCNSGWGGNNNININNNNTFVNNSNRQNNISNRSGNRTGNSWQHNSQHRGGAPYANRATANKYGGTARGDSMGSRQANARQNQGQLGGRQQAGNMDRGGRQQVGAGKRAGGGGNGLASNRAGGGGDRVGNRSVSSGGGGGSRGGGAFGGSGGMSGGSARASSSRGASSMGSRGGGRGGGGRRR